MQWLQEMVAQRGARIERLNMERRDKPGIVTTEMTLTFP
jgi:type II secretory pathway component PulM